MSFCIQGKAFRPAMDLIGPRPVRRGVGQETTFMLPSDHGASDSSNADTICDRSIAVELPEDMRYIGGATIERLLGSGGMGQVFLGRHDTLDIPVAVKVVNSDRLDDARFVREIRATARIDHPNVVRVYNAGAENGRLFLVMEVVDGGDVSDLIKRDGRIPWRSAVSMMEQAAEGLAAIHALGIVHRDLKPANCMLTKDGTLKLADLGLAKQLGDQIDITHTGAIMGTPAYMSPEQIRDTRSVGAPSDVYSLGVTFYQMLVGELPFRGESTTQVILAHLNEPVPNLRRELPAEVPDEVADLLGRMLAKAPIDRPADGAAVAAELGAVARDAVTRLDRGPRRGAAPHRRAPLAFALGGLVALGAVIGLAAGIGQRDAAVPGDAPPVPPEVAPLTATMVAAEQPAASEQPAATEAAPIQVAAPAPGPAPVPAAEPAPAAGLAAWQSPERAVFLLPGDLPPEQALAIEAALMAGAQRVVDRRDIEVFSAEQALSDAGRMSAATAVQIGHGIGGHIAITASRSGDQIALRAFAVETTELTGIKLVAPDEAPAAAVELAASTVGLLPLHGTLRPGADGAYELSVGARHGLSADEQLVVRPLVAGEPGSPVAAAKVLELRPGSATVAVRGALDGAGPWLVEARRD